MENTPYSITITDSLEEIQPSDWDALGGDDDPFLSHAFLHALERHDCLGDRFGWYPRHILIRDQGQLVAACPCYVKTNSYGEFVFDWSWASAYERSGGRYYPKLVCGIPYTPVTGKRLLVLDGREDRKALKQTLIDTAIQFTREHAYSGMHWLFTDDEDTALLRDNNLSLRLGCQYHWHNDGYQDFDDFLSRFSSKKRKNIRRERRMVGDQQLRLDIFEGPEISDDLWDLFYQFYIDTFDKKAGIPTLSLDFFKEIGARLGNRVLLVMAKDETGYIAGALDFASHDSLFGRHWGSLKDYDSLHFETCFYQGIDYAIQHGLKRFEPGAQGEHKITRGFLPTQTWSAHWITDPGFSEVIARFCRQEEPLMQEHCRELFRLSPFREGAAPASHSLPESDHE
jgi:predicted N-acyltransferase